MTIYCYWRAQGQDVYPYIILTEKEVSNMSQTCVYYTAQEVMDILGVSRAKAYKVVKELNEELAAKGYIVTAGKIPKKFLSERLYGMTV